MLCNQILNHILVVNSVMIIEKFVQGVGCQDDEGDVDIRPDLKTHTLFTFKVKKNILKDDI